MNLPNTREQVQLLRDTFLDYPEYKINFINIREDLPLKLGISCNIDGADRANYSTDPNVYLDMKISKIFTGLALGIINFCKERDITEINVMVKDSWLYITENQGRKSLNGIVGLYMK